MEKEEKMPQETVQNAVIQLELGIGVVTPTEKYTDAEVVKAAYEAQAVVEDDAIVCIDERKALNGPEPVRRKTSGGNAVTGFMSAILVDWSLLARADQTTLSQNPNEVFSYVAEHLQNQGLKLGCHVDNHASDAKTNCGANDGIPAVAQDILEASGELAQVVETLMGDQFDTELFNKILQNNEKLVASGFYGAWQSSRVPDVVTSLNGVAEKLNGNNEKPDLDPDNSRHNHWAEAIVFNKNPETSNDRDNAEIPFFQLDQAAIEQIVTTLSTSDYETSLLRHGAYLYNAAVARRLTSNQRVIVIE